MKEVADSIVKYIGFEGECTVRLLHPFSYQSVHDENYVFLQLDTWPVPQAGVE